ncbi:ABC transporter ATP-binding protein/permease [Microbispora hainanensis]|jgi:ATP-binding cassette subfamily B protein|uniref:ABC transporter ATP-binding protein/permease n=1 Tax=Microbispora hainanensis TaxID=568844 RepID=A0ABZ1SXB7_9ACTN|nr:MULTISPECIES: ABC transporter ATP-binding protein [Microbispora]NJP25147.1 ABC transporter ATP-binding protein [Microbispora sp. CL1-1]TQS14050.1 ABC transporter ATP-binding protein [Microbispora sp. SCL1-1]
MAMMNGGYGLQVMRSLRRDNSVTKERIAPGTVRRIAGYARPFRAQIAGFLALVVVDAVIVVANPLLMKAIIDHGITPKRVDVVVWLAVAIGGLAVLDAGLGLVQRWYSARIGEGLIYNLRTEVFDHVQRMPVAFFMRAQTGALVSRLNTDVIGAQRALTSTLSSVVSNVISLVMVLGTMLVLSWQVTLVALVLLPIFIFPAKWVGRRMSALTREQMQLDAEMSSVMTERFNVAGAMVAKLYGRPDDEAAHFAERAGRVRDVGVTVAMYGAVFRIALGLVAALATALVYGLGGALAIGGAFALGTLVAQSSLLMRLYGPLTSLSNVHVDVMTALVSFDRVFEVLDLKPMVAEKPDARPIPEGPVTIEFDDVRFRYPSASDVSLASLESVARPDTGPSQEVLKGVSFTAHPGELVALVGHSGAGKTTITSLVSRLYDVDEGAVRINGVDVRDATLDSIRDTVGVVMQDAHLFHDTIGNNLRYARPEATDEEIWDALRAAQIADLVKNLPEELETVVGDRGYRLSGGEKQRIALARLLLKAPRVVVLDEATAHLDSESEAAVQQALKTALHGRTSLVIAHRLSTIREADTILVIEDGRVVERGRHEELLERGGAYAELYRTQFTASGQSAS